VSSSATDDVGAASPIKKCRILEDLSPSWVGASV
jgi:hypothetical protein